MDIKTTRPCKFRMLYKGKLGEWVDATFHGFMPFMNSDCENNETFFQDTLAVVETKNGVLHNIYSVDWESQITF